MYEYKQSDFLIFQKLGDGGYLCSNFRSGKHIILSNNLFELFNGNPNKLETLQYSNPKVFQRLKDGGFIIDSSIDELTAFQNHMIENLKDGFLYHIIINPTLDCNLSCWYCYENKVPHSKLSKEVELGICRHIEKHYISHPFNVLKVSFFGGEPFLFPDIILNIISFAKDFCLRKSIGLIFDFTTNGTLISESILNAIREYPCLFQITLDGNKTKHNRVKCSKDIPDTFSSTLNNIYLIQNIIPVSITSVRINFDSSTLDCFEEILSELDNLDRLRTNIILKKVWQVESSTISKEQIFNIIDITLDKDFSLDYYSQGGICFADRSNQITFNYDGKIYKCTTISHFDTENSLGHFDVSSGIVSWKEEKISYINNYEIPQYCKLCKLLPLCGGPCRKKAASWKKEDCFLLELGISVEEYALIQFKIELTKQRIIGKYGKV